mgnify:CR=1 FL=1
MQRYEAGDSSDQGFTTSDRAARYCGVLVNKAAEQAWSAAQDIDWQVPPQRPWWLPRRNHVILASQFMHGEQVARSACETLLPRLPQGPFRHALGTQIADEARHVEAYARYLARIGDIAPPRPLLVQALGHVQDWQGSAVGLVLATHVVLESEALAIQQELARDFPCPVLQQISRLSARDEGRHLALGRVLLHAAALPAQPIEVRVDLHSRLRCFWRDCAAAAAADHGLAFARAAPETRLETGWRRLQARFRRVGLIGAGEDSRFAKASV